MEEYLNQEKRTRNSQRIKLPSGAESVSFLTDTTEKDVKSLMSFTIECMHLKLPLDEAIQYSVQAGFTDMSIHSQVDKEFADIQRDKAEYVNYIVYILRGLGYDLRELKEK